jgi:hypothetical protein
MTFLPRSLLTLLVAAVVACQFPQAANQPSHVGSGLLYETGEAQFDAFFSDLHRVQVLLAHAPEEARTIRQELGQRLTMTDSATTTRLSDELHARALRYHTLGIDLRMEIEGADAKDETDTSAQTQVRGTLPEEGRTLVEAATASTRQALRLAARLRAVQSSLDQLGARCLSLVPQVAPVFANRESPRAAEVEQNLEDARRLLPLLSARASEVIDESRRLAERLRAALTTNEGLEQPNALPLISDVTPPTPPPPLPVAKKPATRPAAHRPATTTPKPPASTPKPSAPPADFEP